ncbi:hypothetical protein N9459_05655 [Flavobacteriaceae bacterium]|nr:hypothetical protein [Flavobacteriaceae bacterium]
MGNEVINLDTVFSGFNSGTDLQPKNTRTNNQGVKINEIAGFIKIVSTAPATEDLIKGDMFFALDTSLLTVCTVTGTTLLSIELV